MDEKDLTPANLTWLVSTALDGEAEPEDVKKLLNHFCVLIEAGEAVPKEIEKYLLAGIRDFLAGKKATLDAALGVTRKNHRPKSEIEPRIQIAIAVLQQMMQGENLTNAAAIAGGTQHKSKSAVLAIWKEHGYEAHLRLLLENDRPWTASERSRLAEIFPDRHAEDEKNR